MNLSGIKKGEQMKYSYRIYHNHELFKANTSKEEAEKYQDKENYISIRHNIETNTDEVLPDITTAVIRNGQVEKAKEIKVNMKDTIDIPVYDAKINKQKEETLKFIKYDLSKMVRFYNSQLKWNHISENDYNEAIKVIKPILDNIEKQLGKERE